MNLDHDLAELDRLTVAQLRQRYADVFGEPTHAAHKAWLRKRIAWRMQAHAEGGLSERARQRATLLANDADLRLNPPKDGTSVTVPFPAAAQAAAEPADAAPPQADPRLPPPGSVLTRLYKGRQVKVTVLACGF